MISIILPSIRKDRLIRYYESLVNSCTRHEFELIIVSPLSLPDYFDKITNVKYVKDFGSPVRASNIAAELIEGKYVGWASDDSVLFPNSMNVIMDELIGMGDNHKNVVICGYLEGPNGYGKNSFPPDYYRLKQEGYTSTVPDNVMLFNAAFMHTQFFEELGGWDCQFQVTAIAHNDFAVRAYMDGAIVKMLNMDFCDCDHMPGTSGDHAPVHYAQLEDDQPLFQKLYSPDYRQRQVKIPVNNWKKAPRIWERRFKCSTT